MEKYDLLIKGGMVFPADEIRDIGIKSGQIVALGKKLELSEVKTCIDVSGKVVCPAFVDANLHLAGAFLSDEEDDADVASASARFYRSITEAYEGWGRAAIVEDILERAGKTIEMCIKNGTTAIKANVFFAPVWGTAALEAVQILKQRYNNSISIMSVVKFDPEYEKEWREAAEKGEIDFIGGCPNFTFNSETSMLEYIPDFKVGIDKVFQLAQEYGLGIDMQCYEFDSPNLDMFLYVIQKTMEYKFQDRVTCGHVTGLNARGIDEEFAAQAIARCAKASVHISSMTSCSMYLAGMDRRGPTRVRQMLDAGIIVSIASGNIRDNLNPFGNCDLLEEALLTANVHKFATAFDLRRVLEMITFHPAKNVLLEHYGIWPGCDADLVVLDAPNAAEAILSQADKLYVLKKGKIVAKSGVIL